MYRLLGGSPRSLITAAAAAVVLAAAACSTNSPPAGSPSTGTSIGPGSTTPSSVVAATPPNFKHVVIVVLENQNFETVFGANGRTVAPYLNSLRDKWSFATQYFGVDHNSLANYIALTSGQPPNDKTRADCFQYDCVYPDDVTNIADQLEKAGKSWKAYLDGMPSACAHGTEGQFDPYIAYSPTGNSYATRHNPFAYYGDIVHNPTRCAAHDVAYTALADDLNAHTLPDYSLIVPDLCHDGHELSCGVPSADAWAAQELPHLIDDPGFRDGGVLFVTFDEAEGSDTNGCCGNAKGGHVGTIVISPTWGQQPGFASATPANHYSLLRTIEDAWGLAPLGGAGDPGIKPMTEFFTATPH